jgi:hypothetical protein
MYITAGVTPCNPPRLVGRPRQPTIKRHPALCDDERAPSDNPLVENLIESRAIFRQNTLSHFHTRFSQLDDASAGVPRVYVNRADDDVFDSCGEYRTCAWSSAPRGRARLQSNVQRRLRWHGRTEISETLDFRMIAPSFPMVSFGYHSIVYDQHRSHSRIRAGLAKRLFCLAQRSTHELFVSLCRHCLEK